MTAGGGQGSPSHAGGGGSAVRRERVVAEQEAAVLAARSELAKASRQMARYGEVGAAAVGLESAEAPSIGSASVKGE